MSAEDNADLDEQKLRDYEESQYVLAKNGESLSDTLSEASTELPDNISDAGDTSEQESPLVESVASKLAKKQKKISVSQFLEANLQMLGFSSPGRNLLITVKETVDNSIDAADDAGMLPKIDIVITKLKPKLYQISVQDYGPGLSKQSVPKVFGTLLYGSKFGKNQQRRGQQGLGISAVILNSQVTTGLPTKIISKCKDLDAYSQYIAIDVEKNMPSVTNLKKVTVDYESGVCVTVHVKGAYISEGTRSIKHYLKLVSILNPYAEITLKEPSGNLISYPRIEENVPTATIESKLHPKTTELGVFSRLLREYSGTIEQFLLNEIHSSNPTIVSVVLRDTGIDPEINARALVLRESEDIYERLQSVNFLVPSESLVTIGEKTLLKALNAQDHEFSVSFTGDAQLFKNTIGKIELVAIYDSQRFARDSKIDVTRAVNRVPLLLQAGACLLTKAITMVNWKNYGLQHTKGEMPVGPLRLFIHLAGIRVGFTSESKEAVAENPPLEKYVRECLRKLGLKISKKLRQRQFIKKQREKALFVFANMPMLFESTGVEVNHPVIYSRVLSAVLYRKQGEITTFYNYTGHSVNCRSGEQVHRISNESVTSFSLGQARFDIDGLFYELPAEIPVSISELREYTTKTTQLHRQDLPAAQKIQMAIQDIRTQMLYGNPPVVKIRIRNKNNLVLHEAGYWVLGSKLSLKTITKLTGLVTVVQIVKLLKFIGLQLARNKTNSLRECYYQSEAWGVFKFDSQEQSDRAIESAEVFLGCDRAQFGIYPELRGQIAGPLRYIEGTKRGEREVDCLLDLPTAGSGITIPHKVSALKITSCEASFILAIQTAGMFNRILENNFHLRYNCILISLVGQPTRSIKQLITILAEFNKQRIPPVFGFYDCDGWSLGIHASIQYGAAKTAHIADRLVLPNAKHLGLKFKDVEHYNLPSDKLTKQDILCLERLLVDPRFTDAAWKQHINAQIAAKRKCEQQALAALDIDHVTNVYLPTKLAEYGFYPVNEA